jgi:hypothetical protein
MSAPRPAVVLVIGPSWRRYPTPSKRSAQSQRKDTPWRPAEAIPGWERRELQRRIEDMRERARRMTSETRPQRETLRAAGRALRVWARERRTGVPFIPYEAA